MRAVPAHCTKASRSSMKLPRCGQVYGWLGRHCKGLKAPAGWVRVARSSPPNMLLKCTVVQRICPCGERTFSGDLLAYA